MKKQTFLIALLILVLGFGCGHSPLHETDETKSTDPLKNDKKVEYNVDTTFKTIHIFVALCDNRFQGIVPVPEKIGNGQNPNANLYWGCGYGIRTYFKKSSEWKWLKTYKLDSIRLERIVFQHVSQKYYLIADAYDGEFIKNCTLDFLNSSSDNLKDTLHIENKVIGLAGFSSLIAYIGHDGLMDFEITEKFSNSDGITRDLIILACYSKYYFSQHLKEAQVNPLIWTTGLMCPEAYTIHDALTGYVKGETVPQIRQRAAAAYSKYLHCTEKAVRNLLVTGWE